MFSPELIAIFTDLQVAETRQAGTRALAVHAAVTDVLVFSRDPDIDVFLPVPGLPQTLPDGLHWQRFLADSARAGCGAALLPIPDCATPQPVFALADSRRQCIIVFVGEPDMQRMTGIGMLLPLLGPTFVEERAALVARGQARAARHESIRSAVINQALDRSRQHIRSAWRHSRQQLDSKLSHQARRLENEQRHSQFLNLLTLQLRDPLAPIANALKIIEMISPDAPGPARVARQIIAEQAQRLQTLVDDLLEVAHLEDAHLQLHMEASDLGECAHAALASLQARLNAREQRVHHYGLEQAVPIWADREAVIDMISALLDNASQFTPHGGELQLTLNTGDAHASLCIADQGIGIDADRLPELFDLFTHPQQAFDAERGGLRLGLYRTRRLVELHGGELSAASAGKNRGSSFTLRFPLHV